MEKSKESEAFCQSHYDVQNSKWTDTTDYLSNKFIFRNDTTSYRLRNSEMRLALPQPRTDYVRKSFSYSGAALWNSLPTDLRVSQTLGDFKTKLSNFTYE